MKTLDDLLGIDGVIAAGEFTADGRLADYKANVDMSREMAEMSAQFCATITMTFNTLAWRLLATEPDEMGAAAGLDVRWRRHNGSDWRQQMGIHRDRQGRLQPVVPGSRRRIVTQLNATGRENPRPTSRTPYNYYTGTNLFYS